tara:strand:+ start:1646 stop:1825 length:180 start_codon:yes stop_codon:yes gene_type:complete
MSISIKGKQGFQSQEPELKKNKRIVVYLTESELIKLQSYSNKKESSISTIVREFIIDKI